LNDAAGGGQTDRVRVLVVDDDALLRRSLQLLLNRAGYEVREAEDGQAAWDLIQREPIHFVITDWNMPLVNGPQLVSRIRTTAFPSYVYVIMLTVHTQKLDVVDGLLAGADDYLTKPFDLDELRARIAIGVRILGLEARLMRSVASAAELAMRDSLTGLFNRRAFDNRLSEELQRAVRYERPLSLLMIDIDHFKRYNDQHGHPQGDVLLRELSGLLLGCIRSTDFVARYGGEEFAVILPETSPPHALSVANTLLERVRAHPLPLRETQPGGALTVSIGIAGHSPDRPNADRLVQAADQALYQAKGAGRNRLVAV
jgi:two-component system cell cycle response regulator